MLAPLYAMLQYLLPKHLLTRLAGWLAKQAWGTFTYQIIKGFVKVYGVNMQEAHSADLRSYPTFNAFFIRSLREGARPILSTPESVVCPADGVISQLGDIHAGELVQAKGHLYTLDSLLAGNSLWVPLFLRGRFVTTYLSPKDYHRVHMPCDGVLREMIYVPGSLFSVNHRTTQQIPALFARNERVLCFFDTPFGPMAQILVGATIVGSIATVWAGVIAPPRLGVVQRWTYPALGEEGVVSLHKGDEMGHFQLGSTVITLFAENAVQFATELHSNTPVRLGTRLAMGVNTSH